MRSDCSFHHLFTSHYSLRLRLRLALLFAVNLCLPVFLPFPFSSALAAFSCSKSVSFRCGLLPSHPWLVKIRVNSCLSSFSQFPSANSLPKLSACRQMPSWLDRAHERRNLDRKPTRIEMSEIRLPAAAPREIFLQAVCHLAMERL